METERVTCANCEKEMAPEHAHSYYVTDVGTFYTCSEDCRQKWYADTRERGMNGFHQGDR